VVLHGLQGAADVVAALKQAQQFVDLPDGVPLVSVPGTSPSVKAAAM
jgi:hypothetical protein